ncbi:MAG TPA: hypothetical protein VK841_23120 [Polyangiaceae bacterium]|nr:hypothetical protein [Polyangiaceae bacterium]
MSDARTARLRPSVETNCDAMKKAGILLAGDPLQPSVKGARVTVSGGKRKGIELNRAVAIAAAVSPEAALAIVDRLGDEPSLRGYPFLPSVRADLLARLGRFAEARREIEPAIALTR